MKVLCPNCGEFVLGADVDLSRSLAVCRPCNELVPLPQVVSVDGEGRLRWEGDAMLVAREVANVPIYAYRPDRLPINEARKGPEVVLALREELSTALIFLIAAFCWNACVYLWVKLLFSSDSSILGPLRYLFPTLHVAVGVYLVWGCLCLLFNRTVMTVGKGKVAMSQGPLPWEKPFEEPISNIRCFVDTQFRVNRFPDRWFRPNMAWTVTLLTKDHRSLSLPIHLGERDHARYIALRLNRAVDEMRAPNTRPGSTLDLGD